MTAYRCGFNRSISIRSDAVCKIGCRLSQMTNQTIPRPSRAELEICASMMVMFAALRVLERYYITLRLACDMCVAGSGLSTRTYIALWGIHLTGLDVG